VPAERIAIRFAGFPLYSKILQNYVQKVKNAIFAERIAIRFAKMAKTQKKL